MFGNIEQKIVARDKMLSGIAEMLELGISSDEILALAKAAAGEKTVEKDRKEQILEALSMMEWSDELKDKLEYEVSAFVVYQEDPDDHHTYCHKYHATEEDARKDFNARTFVPDGRWCYCVISSTKSKELWERREIFI